MRFALAAVAALVVLLRPASAETRSYPDGYWDREFPNYQQAQLASTYNIGLLVKDADAAQVRIDKIADAEGAKLINMNNGYNYGGQGYSRPRVRLVKTISYRVPSAKAEAVARKFSDAGILQNYNLQQLQQQNFGEDVAERIAELERELSKNAAALADMPAAQALLQGKLNRLKQSRDSMRSNDGFAQISISLMVREDPPEKTAAPSSPQEGD